MIPSRALGGPDYSFVDSSQVHVLTTSSVHMLEGERPDLDWSLQRFRRTS